MSVQLELHVILMQSVSIFEVIIDVSAESVGKALVFLLLMDAQISTSVQQEETSATRKQRALIMMEVLNANVLNLTGPTLKVGFSTTKKWAPKILKYIYPSASLDFDIKGNGHFCEEVIMTLGDRRRIQEAIDAGDMAAAEKVREDRLKWTIENFNKTGLVTGSKIGMTTK